MSVADDAERHALAMKYAYARLALSSPTRFRETMERDPAYFVDLWRAHARMAGLPDAGVPSVSLHGEVGILSFPPSTAAQACRHVAVRLQAETARVFFLESPHPSFRAAADQSVLVEVDAAGRTHHGLVVVGNLETLAHRIAAKATSR